jgi:hypothetical protein
MNVNPFGSEQNPIRCDGLSGLCGLLLKGVGHRRAPISSPTAAFAVTLNVWSL